MSGHGTTSTRQLSRRHAPHTPHLSPSTSARPAASRRQRSCPPPPAAPRHCATQPATATATAAACQRRQSKVPRYNFRRWIPVPLGRHRHHCATNRPTIVLRPRRDGAVTSSGPAATAAGRRSSRSPTAICVACRRYFSEPKKTCPYGVRENLSASPAAAKPAPKPVCRHRQHFAT